MFEVILLPGRKQKTCLPALMLALLMQIPPTEWLVYCLVNILRHLCAAAEVFALRDCSCVNTHEIPDRLESDGVKECRGWRRRRSQPCGGGGGGGASERARASTHRWLNLKCSLCSSLLPIWEPEGRFSPVPPCLKLVSGPAETKSLLLADFLVM